MKLNLLPTHVGKERQGKVAVVGAVLIVLAAAALTAYMIMIPAGRLESLDSAIAEERRVYNILVTESAKADSTIADAKMLITNMMLADAMLKHSTVYPDLYDDIRRYVPSFFRTISMTAQPASADTSVVTITGVLKTYQQYADLMLALLKNPSVVSVTRAGFQQFDPRVPALTPVDQKGKPIKPGEAPIPDDPLERLDYFIAQGRTTGFTGTGGFGTDDLGPRGAMPEWSVITLTLVVRKNLQTPDPRATLASQGGGAPATGAGGAPLGGGRLTP